MTPEISSTLLARYAGVLHLSEQMLESARRGEWDRLIELEQARAGIVEELKQKDKMSWQGREASKKSELIRAILAADAETKVLAESSMGELQKVLGSIGIEKKLHKAYEVP